jgi:predicted amidophosphoribosyltransferase
MLKDFADLILNIIYPPACGFCGQIIPSHDMIVCKKCEDSIPKLQMPCCILCGKMIPSGTIRQHCIDCYNQKRYYSKVISVYE